MLCRRQRGGLGRRINDYVQMSLSQCGRSPLTADKAYDIHGREKSTAAWMFLKCSYCGTLVNEQGYCELEAPLN